MLHLFFTKGIFYIFYNRAVFWRKTKSSVQSGQYILYISSFTRFSPNCRRTYPSTLDILSQLHTFGNDFFSICFYKSYDFRHIVPQTPVVLRTEYVVKRKFLRKEQRAAKKATRCSCGIRERDAHTNVKEIDVSSKGNAPAATIQKAPLLKKLYIV